MINYLNLEITFRWVLHNSDDEFGEKQLKYLDIPNFPKNIYTKHEC